MANIINSARLKQRSLVITLLDLKNAFGTVHHNLILEVLKFHHIPNHIRDLVHSVYTNFQTSMIAPHFHSPFLYEGHGVVKGDCLSPLLFNLCLNTFFEHIKAEKYKQFGFPVTPVPILPLFRFTGFKLLMMLQLFVVKNRKIRFCLIALAYGVNGLA